MKLNAVISIMLLITIGCGAQENNIYKLVGGPCEGCEAVFEYGDKELAAADTILGFVSAGTKLKISGTVYKNDGITPAENVILYLYQTNEEGIYLPDENETGWGLRHGSARSWLKTDENGNYTIYTFKPGTYPNRSEPAHIHLTILEPDGKYYWLSSYFFEGDPLLSEEDYHKENPRGGSNGILSLSKENDILIGKRNIVLGKNIPDY